MGQWRTRLPVTVEDFVEPRYQYACVERAIFTVNPHRISVWRPKTESEYRGHIRQFQRFGLMGSNLGRGTKPAYSFEMASRLLIALLFHEWSGHPAHDAAAIIELWDKLFRDMVVKALDGESRAGNPIWLVIEPHYMTGGWAGDKICFKAEGVRRYKSRYSVVAGGKPIYKGRDDNLKTHVERLLARGCWAVACDLTGVMTQFEKALA